MRRLLALVIPLLLSGGPALAATPSPPHGQGQHASRASRDRAPAPKPPVAITLGSVSPAYLRASSTLRVRGRLVNQSQSTYQRVSVRLRYSSHPMLSRGQVETFADDKGPDPLQAGLPRQISTTLPVGGQQQWKLALSVRQMGLSTFGVYPISVEVMSGGIALGHLRTFVTYYPAGTALQRTKVAWVWPLVDQPHRAADTTFVDDQLERQLGSGGRLFTLVNAAGRTTTPVSWLIDPSLVDDATKMANTDGYNIKGDVDRPQSVAALNWLTALHGAVANDHLISTPYADPDVTALADRHMSRDVSLAAQQGTRALADAHLSGATPSTAMPPDDLPVDQATLSSLVASGSRTILLSSAILPDAQVETFTPDPVVNKNISGMNVKLVAYDDTLRKILNEPTTEPGGTILAEQRFLAETAMITGEAPQKARTIVITPPRRWKPSATFAKAVLNYTAKAPWLRPVPLSDVQTLKPTGRTFQPQKSSSGLSKNYLRQVRDLSTDVRKFTSIFQPTPVSDFTLGIARTESSAWHGQSRRGKLVRDTLKDELEKSMDRIKVLNDGTTMAGKSGRIPITISNGLDRGTVKVTLHAYSQNTTRLRVNAVDRTLVLEHGHKDQVTLDMKASANGIADVYLQLRTPDGQDFGGAHVLRVNATGYGRTALLITGISLAVLFVGVAIRIVRRRADRAGESVE